MSATPLEQEIRETKAIVKMLLNSLSPTISFAELKGMLGIEADSTGHAWLKRHSITKVTKGRYARLKVMQAITN